MPKLRPPRWSALGLLGLLYAPAAFAAGAAPPTDSLRRETFTLANGLRVVTVDVPRAQDVAVVVAYPGGRDQEPPRREGLWLLLAELQFTAATTGAPERSRAEMESLRPRGYDIKVSRRYTSFTEIASRAQFPGVLHQVAERMRGVTLSPAVIAAATETVRRQLQTFYSIDPAQSLYYEVRDLAGGADSSVIRRLEGGRGLEGLTARELDPRLAEAFRPSSAVLCVAGNLTGINLRALIERELSGLPAAAAPPPGGLPFSPGGGVERRRGLDAPVGVVGVLAPALQDSLHPSFYLTLLVIGFQANQIWGPPEPPIRSRFQYALLDDPDLARFYPPTPLNAGTAADLLNVFHGELLKFSQGVAFTEDLEDLKKEVVWMLGGPTTPAFRRALRSQSGVLNTFAGFAAVRELWGGEAFWSTYRARFATLDHPANEYWTTQMAKRERQVALLFRPAR